MYLTNFYFYQSKNYLYSKPVKGLRGYEVGYGFAFNGMELDNETYGEGNAYDFGARIYDPRLCRFLGIDNKSNKYPGINPFNFSLNSPLVFNDPDGNGSRVTIQKNPDGNGGKIVMETVVYLYGQDKEILESTAKLMNESFGKFNNKATVQDVNKKCWEVVINVTYKAAPEIKDEEVAKCQDLNIFTKDARSLSTDTKNKIGFVNGDNIMKINPYSGQTGVLGHTTMGANSAVAANAQPVIFEETFHMLGFDEHYPTSLTQESIIPELRGSVMSSGGIEINPTFVHPVFFYTIADYFNVVEKSVNVTEKKNTNMTNKNLESTDKGEAFFDPKSKSSMDIAKSKEVVNSDNCKP